MGNRFSSYLGSNARQPTYQSLGALALSLFLCATPSYSQEPGKFIIETEGQPPLILIPTVAKLNFERVEFLLITSDEYYGRLNERALAQFAKAGLYPAGSRKSPAQKETQPVATLTLKLDPQPLDDVCKDKVLYQPSLKMEEYVTPERNPDLRARSVTWAVFNDGPPVRPSVSLEQLEEDLHVSLYQFILAYNMGNPPKKTPKKRP